MLPMNPVPPVMRTTTIRPPSLLPLSIFLSAEAMSISLHAQAELKGQKASRASEPSAQPCLRGQLRSQSSRLRVELICSCINCIVTEHFPVDRHIGNKQLLACSCSLEQRHRLPFSY